ncbi:DEAD/DEAH box helicase family protein [Chlorobium sp. BLA1]|uniref:DEAD/DEAH box helicase n=1 Tax=Candidatus Chlorobium masyuteum TaxID=2716876 RepID=UPI0014208E81|nr:DEAD/DEAH box helicase family protein [Candidatus Chlorobium masyuteum]NHQ59730.1 DEAD/DEAH box helicase family protein [Candidatus Chlorobium masyuteum]
MITLKDYQRRVLQALKDYFIACQQYDSADTAFYSITRQSFGTGIPYREVSELPGLPYVCLRIPTGGGKTIVASYATGIAAKDFLHSETPFVLWLVPSNTIKEQTITALQDRKHPYRKALEEVLPAVEVLSIQEALSLNRSTVTGNATIIVSTMQAFRVDETEGRKVYEQSGALMEHFSTLDPSLTEQLDRYDNGQPVQSFANLLKLHHPIIIVDEAHNSRTQLSFETLSRFNPSCIIEFTATPATESNPSNVLYSVSAAELKADQMIKMPIRLETRPNWKELISDAITLRQHLEQEAIKEKVATGEHIRPIMLIQAQAKSQTHETLTVEVVEQCLLDDFNIPIDQIRRATGSDREIDGINLADPGCTIRYIITVQALREGWDCPFAYVLCSVAEMRSPTAVEQILGRIMRLPGAKRKQSDELNMAYAFSASRNFVEAAKALENALVLNGFNRLEAKELITNLPVNHQGAMDLFAETKETIEETPCFGFLPEAIQKKVSYDIESKALTFTGEMDDAEKQALLECFVTPEGKESIERVFQNSRRYLKKSVSTPAERFEIFAVPVLSVRQGNLFEQFEETHFHETPWKLSKCSPELSESEYSTKRFDGKLAEIDITNRGQLSVRFVDSLHQQLSLLNDDKNQTVSQLVYWIDRNLPNRRDILPTESGPYLIGVIHYLMNERGLTLSQLFNDKYTLRQRLSAKIDDLRRKQWEKSYQTFILPECATPLVVSPDVCFTFKPTDYPYNTRYQGSLVFKKHYYRDIASMNGEEESCAAYLDHLPEVEFWVRNLEQRPTHSFWLQTSTDKFYPDFVCKLNDGRILVVEYKSETSWSNDDSREKRVLGELWAKRSNGTCLFVMPKGKDLQAIKASVRQ